MGNIIDKAIARFDNEAYTKDSALMAKAKEFGGLCHSSERWIDFVRSEWEGLEKDLGFFAGAFLLVGYALRDIEHNEVRIETPNSNPSK